jgi:uncharacterized damage-inducible protein DinB
MKADHPSTLTQTMHLPGNLAAWLASRPAQPGIGNPAARPDESGRILQAATAILAQGENLLLALTPDHFAQKVPVAFNASIGGHYRHCLDHFTSVVRSLGSDLVDYDDRERDARIETEPGIALAVTRELRKALAEVSPTQLHQAVVARCEVSYDHNNSPLTASSLGRELVYCIAHAIHHYALIAVMARLLGVQLPEHFGIAPSTVAHQKAAAA